MDNILTQDLTYFAFDFFLFLVLRRSHLDCTYYSDTNHTANFDFNENENSRILYSVPATDGKLSEYLGNLLSTGIIG